jgi:CRISPR-associated Csx2 family protein
MAKVLISFLGTNNYVPCNYYYGDKENKVSNVRFVQEAIIELLCQDFKDEDKMLFFLTDDAKTKNWEDDGQLDYKQKPPAPIIQKGLATTLRDFKTAANVHEYRIENGFSSTEIWKIFETVFDKLNDGDEVHFDITHAFRSLPMLGMVLMNYAKSIHKDLTIQGIYYGAFEKLGAAPVVARMPLEERNAEIINLISFSIMQEWTNAANEFIHSGRTKGIEELIKENNLKKIITTEDKAVFETFKNFSEALNNMSFALSTVRGTEIVNAVVFSEVRKIADELSEQKFVAPLQPLLERISNTTKVFSFEGNYEVLNGFRAIDLCLEFNLIQQGITLHQEMIITFLIDYFKKYHNQRGLTFKKWQCRNVFSRILTYLAFSEAKRKEEADKQTKLAKKLMKIDVSILKEFSTLFAKLRLFRNDINHGGFEASNNYKGEDFKNRLITISTKTKEAINQYLLTQKI